MLAAASHAEPLKDTLTFGGEAAYPPFEWSEGGTPRGFYVELAQALGGDEKAVVHRLGAWPDAVRALADGSVDAVAMFHSEERARRFLLSTPFYFVNHVIYARAEAADVSSLEDMHGHTVAVEELSYAHERLGAEARPIELVLEPSTVAALDAVASGRAEFALLAGPTASYLVRTLQLPLRRVSPPLWPRGYAFAVHRDRPELAAWLDQRLEQILRNGSYRRIYERWERQLEPGSERPKPWPWLEAILLALVSAVVIGLWTYRRGRRDGAAAAPGGSGIVDQSLSQWASDHDAYTDLPRLHVFVERVDAILARTEPEQRRRFHVVAVKPVSLERTIRTEGHAAGLTVARALVEQLRALDLEAYGQTGRDVFLLFGSHEQIRSKLRALAATDDTGVLSVATGPMLVVGSAAAELADAAELVRRAEAALSRALERREGWLEYRADVEPDMKDLQLIELFRQTAGAGVYALFQPQVDVRTGAVVGGEALARWDAPGIGVVPPGKFVPLLEDAGLLKHLTSRMLAEGVRVGAELRRRGHALPIGVNVSVSDLLGGKTRQSIFKHLQAYGTRPEDLKLELTETSFAENPDALRLVLLRLRDSGIRIAIDDFGTGYSSLSYLRDLPVDEVKIDQSFVRTVAARRDNRTIVRSMIEMAHELGLSIVAEGVEDDACLRVLREDGCDSVQGYLIAKPLAEDDFLRFVAANAGTAHRSARV